MMTAEQLAQFFHESYERLAPWFGYKTREESAKPWANVPEQNRKLMTAVCAEVLTQAAAQLAEKEREIARLHKLFCDLTPGGSEFAGDPDYCTKYLQQKLETQGELLKKKVIALRQREAELEQRWIAAEEQMPEDGLEVLIWVGRQVKSAHRVLVGSGRAEIRKWDSGHPSFYESEGKVTHWQPLPSPPKEAKS